MWRRCSRGRRWVVLVALIVGGCGDDAPTVTITEADPVAARPTLTPDTLAPDTTLADSLLAPDSTEVTALEDTIAAAPAPDFDTFWLGFQAAVRSGNVGAVTQYARLGQEGIGMDDVEAAYIRAFNEPFRSSVLALSPRDFERDGTAREIRVVVGFDEQNRVVREDEAVRDEAIRLRFDVVDGRYRWTGFEADAEQPLS